MLPTLESSKTADRNAALAAKQAADGASLEAYARFAERSKARIRGLEKQARDAGIKVKTGKFPFAGNSKASIIGHHEGFVKVVAEEKYGEILGVHAIGPLATEIIAEPVAAIGLEATLDDMFATIHAHPTLWEAMGDAFNAVRGLSINA